MSRVPAIMEFCRIVVKYSIAMGCLLIVFAMTVINDIYLLFFQDDLGNDFGGYNEYDDFI